MGRTKVQIRSIEDAAKRKTTFMKRNAGVMKKAMEISVLCHCEVALVIFDEHGNLHQFASKDLHPTLERVRLHKGKKEVRNNDTLLRSLGVIKERMAAENEDLGNQIHLTPASQTGLNLKAESFGGMVAGTERHTGPTTPPVTAPSSPERDAGGGGGFFGSFPDEMDTEMDKWKYDLESDWQAPKEFASDQKIPPKVQRNVDSLMRDIQVMHQASELIKDQRAQATVGSY